MSDVASVPALACEHALGVIGIERTGRSFDQRVFFVERCVDCGLELGRRRASRGYDSQKRGDAS